MRQNCEKNNNANIVVTLNQIKVVSNRKYVSPGKALRTDLNGPVTIKTTIKLYMITVNNLESFNSFTATLRVE